MSEYTPTTDDIRNTYAFLRVEADEFDRWLAAHDAEVKAEAWDEGYSAGNNTGLCGGCEDCELWSNPYRKVVE